MDLSKNRIIIWGTGKRAERLMQEAERCTGRFSLKDGFFHHALCFFVDRDQRKQKGNFYGYPVRDPADVDWGKDDWICIVALAQPADVMKYLTDVSALKRERMLTDREYIREMHREIVCSITDKAGQGELCPAAERELKAAADALRLPTMDDGRRNISGLLPKYHPHEIIHAIRFLEGDATSEVAKNWCSKTSEERVANDYLKERDGSTLGLVIQQYGKGGAERVVSRLLPVYLDMGYRVVLISKGLDVDYAYDLPEGVFFVRIAHTVETDPAEHFREYENAIRQYSIGHICFHMPYEGSELLYLLMLAQLLGCRIYVENHTSVSNFLRQRGGLKDTDVIYKLADRVIVLSMADASFWREKGCKSIYIANPCMPPVPECRKKSRGTERSILWIGRLNQKYKRVWDIVPIMKEVLRGLPNAKMRVVGSAEKEADYLELIHRIQKEGLEKSIELLGGKKNVGHYYRTADVMLMTSPGEGFPMVLTEAMAYALPTVMYELPELEMTRKKKGFLGVPQENTHAAAEMLLKVLTDDDLWRRLSAEAQEVAALFSGYDIRGAWRAVFDGQEISEEENEAFYHYD